MTISLDQAQTIVNAALAHGTAEGFNPLTVAVLDPGGALVALGRRSLSGYLTQSLVFVPALTAWGLGLGAHLSSATAMLVGIGVWLLTVVVAHRMDLAGVRGPAEVLLRRLTYRPTKDRAPQDAMR